MGILLAAGLGERYDRTGRVLKLLEPFNSGSNAGVPIVAAAARNLHAALATTLAVVRPLHHPHQPQLHELLRKEGCEIVVCDRAAEGVGASLVRGIQACNDADGWIVALGDMPAIDPATIKAVVQAVRDGHATAAPVYRGQRGHPVGFSATCRAKLLRCEGDRGARTVLDAVPPHLIEVDDAGTLIDIDQR